MATETVPVVEIPAQEPDKPNKDLALAPPKNLEFDADDPVALYMNASVFEQLQRVGKLMAASNLVPDAFKGKVADCVLVAAQAFRWRMDPFALVQNTYVLRGKLGYEGKVVAGVINSSRRIEERLSYEYTGSGRDRMVVVSGKIRGEARVRTIVGKVADWATDNEQWKKGPDQMLAYRGAREWARRHMPEAMIGISAEEEIRETIRMERGPDGVARLVGSAIDQLTERLAQEHALKAETPEEAPETPETPETPVEPTAPTAEPEPAPAPEPAKPAAEAHAAPPKPRQTRLVE